MQTEDIIQAMKTWLDSEEFDNLAYAYRSASPINQAIVIEMFEQLKQGIMFKFIELV